MQEIEQLAQLAGKSDDPALISGETGVGKTFVAKAIHHLSKRRAARFIELSCTALPPDLFELELFGQAPSAFSGAATLKRGRIEFANGGTLLLNHVEEVAPSVQVRVLRLLDGGEFHRNEGRELLNADVRVITTSNRDLQALVNTGSFCAELYERLKILHIVVPPLRERREEIPAFVEYFVKKFRQELNQAPPRLSADAMDLLSTYSWPANIRELESLIKRFVALGDERSLCEEVHFRLRMLQCRSIAKKLQPLRGNFETGLREIARHAAQEAEISAVTDMLEQVNWNRAEAARRLKVSYATLLAKLRREELDAKSRGPARGFDDHRRRPSTLEISTMKKHQASKL